MRILFISTLTSPFGGSEVLWYNAALKALKKNHEVHVITYKWATIPTHIKSLKDNGALIHFRPYNTIFNSKLLYKLYHKSTHIINKQGIFSKIDKIKPNVIVVNQGGSYNAIEDDECYYFLSHTNIPFIITARFNYDYVKPADKLTYRAKQIFPKASKLIFASLNNAISLQQQLLLALNKNEVITSPLNLKSKNLLTFPSIAESLNIACVARLEINIKGQAILMHALASVEWRTRKWKLNFYGSGPDLDYLKELSEYLNIAKNIVYHGHVNDIQKVHETNHVLVLPSFHEGSPISLQEAMICGRPAIVTDVGGNSEFIEDGLSGFICEAPTIKLLNKTLNKCWENRERLKEMGEYAHKRIKEIIPEEPEQLFLKVIEDAAKGN
jgi:glycosyltransferase involved in cell wall biosynthesis